MKLEQSTLINEIKCTVQNSNIYHLKRAGVYNGPNIVIMALKMKGKQLE